MQPWHNWFHCTGSVYGQWLPGSQKGWRERKHRKHVDADYKHPFPKGQFDGLHRRSQELLKRDPVALTYEQRVEVCKAFYEALVERNIEVAEISIGRIHWHALTRFIRIDQIPTHDRDPKLLIGAAKGKCSFILGKREIVKPGGIWAQGCRTLPIEDEQHYRNSKAYIHDHLTQGAAVLTEIIQTPIPQL